MMVIQCDNLLFLVTQIAILHKCKLIFDYKVEIQQTHWSKELKYDERFRHQAPRPILNLITIAFKVASAKNHRNG